MQNILHRGAKTTPKIRKEIHDSTESLMVLAQRYNLNFKTILKWKHREDFSDKPSGAIKPKSVLSDQEQAVICEFRRITQFPLDDVFVALKDKIPALTRSNLYRCLKRFGYQKLPQDSILKKEHQSFKTYELGFIHLDIASLHTAEAKAQGEQSTIIECDYDYIGRRYTKKVTSNGTVSLQQRYIYRGYLQIACVDLTRSEHPALWYITWDPTEPIATRPLAIQKNATWYTYSHDLTKNVTELYQSDGLIATTYDYSPYGAATAEGIDQPLQWSSEYHGPELALTYYNYRHYNPTDGRWINRDPIGEDGGFNLYGFVRNNALLWFDYVGYQSLGDWVMKTFAKDINRKILDKVQYKKLMLRLLEKAARGCIGVVGCSLGQTGDLDMSKCYKSQNEAQLHLKDLNCCDKLNMQGEPASARIFSVHTYEGAVINNKGQQKNRKFSARPDGTYDVSSITDRYAAGEGLGMFDFALSQNNGMMLGATQADLVLLSQILAVYNIRTEPLSPDESRDYQTNPPRISIRTEEDWKKEIENNAAYNTEFWCITCEDNALIKNL